MYDIYLEYDTRLRKTKSCMHVNIFLWEQIKKNA